MAINERVITGTTAEAGNGGAGSGNQEEGLILHLDANDVDSYDGDGSVWYDITNHEYKPATNVSEHFNTVLYTGNGASTNDITGVGFSPDLVWIKNRSKEGANWVTDSVRGAGKGLMTQSTSAELTTLPELMSSFNSDGFTVGFSANDTTNGSTNNYVAWCFKAGGAPSGSDKVSIDGTSYATMTAAGLTDGTEPISKLSVNTKLGFSIVKHTAPALTGDTVAHGLGETPEMIILKSSSVARNWNVFHKDVGTSKNMHLNTTDAANTSEYWTANSNTFSIQDYSASADWIAYAFTSKRGVSKVGSYKGTGAAGNKVYTGFEPAWIIIKNISTSHWYMFDNKRETTNPRTLRFLANSSNAEGPLTNAINFDLDGFTLNDLYTINKNYNNFIYYVIAKDNSETSLIPDTDLELHLDAASFPQKGETGYSNTPTTWTALTGNNGTITGGALFDSELGNWLELDGSDDKIDVGNISAFNTTNSFTLEFWENRDDTNENCFAAKGTYPSDAGWFFSYNTSYGYYFYDYGTGSYIRAGSTYSAGQWRHVVLTWNASTKTPNLFVDGEDVSATVSIGTGTGTNNTVSMQIGNGSGRAGAQAGFDGKLGQVRGYSSALTQDQIRQNFNFTKNDYPNGYNGTITGATWNSSGYFDFDGSDDKVITSGGASGLTFGDSASYTIGCWVYNDSNGRLYSTIGAGGGAKNQNAVSLASGQVNIFYTTGTGTAVARKQTSTSVIPTNNWSHIVVTQSGTTIKLYVNGEEVSLITGSSTTISLGSNIILGSHGTGYTPYFDGRISKVKIYDKILTQAEITALYNEGE